MFRRRSGIAIDLLLLGLLLFFGYFLRLSHLPVVGEEGRRARGAINMIETGDWVVVRQGGVVFPDRPPMSNWLIAGAAMARGEVDRVAIRFPSAVAILLTTLLIYSYCRGAGLSRLTALSSSAAFATFGQVLQLGRTGESEAEFTFFVAASLLLWHLGYLRRWPAVTIWSLGWGFAALAGLTKGLQGPVYFAAATGVFLLARRRWGLLFGGAQWLGAALFALLVGAWQLPYYLRTDLESVRDTWFSVVGPRLGWQGLAHHLGSFPLELLGSLLPWSLLLFLLLCSPLRRRLEGRSTVLPFLIVALAVTFPSVWFSQGAKTRYYLPLYPCFAILVGMVIHSWSTAPEASSLGRWRRRAWWGLAGIALAAGVMVLLAGWGLLPGPLDLRLGGAWLLLLVAIAGVAVVGTLAAARREPGENPEGSRSAVFAMALLLAALYHVFWGNVLAQRWVDLRPGVEALRSQIPRPEKLVSFGPIDSRFAYPYEHRIREFPWPEGIEDIPGEVQYFALDWRPTDDREERQVWRGMKTWTTPGTLPFQWRELGRVSVDRTAEAPPSVAVIVGEVLRDEEGRPLPVKP